MPLISDLDASGDVRAANTALKTHVFIV
jgi:hypothetical protein